MTDNVRKIFDMLGVEPNEEFEMLLDTCKFSFKCKIDENLQGYFLNTGTWFIIEKLLRDWLNGSNTIIKLPKKKKLRDLTEEEYKKWVIENCDNGILCCKDCVFRYVNCDKHFRWIDRKDLYSDKFLDQEIEVE